MANVQYTTLIEHYPALVTLLKHSLPTIAYELLAKSLITKGVCDSILAITGESDENKAARLVSCVADGVNHGSAKAFYDFLDVLDKESYFSYKVDKIRKSCARREAEMLKKDVLSMQKQLQSEIETNNEVSPLELVNALTLLPESVRVEYRKFVSTELGTPARPGDFLALFCHLKPHFTSLDYQVLECLINRYGSAKLNEDMSAYCWRVRIFKERTIVRHVVDHLCSGRHDVPSHFSVLKVKMHIRDFMHYTLLQLDSLKEDMWTRLRKLGFGAGLSMSQLYACCLSLSEVTMEDLFTPIVSWTLPSLLCPISLSSVITLCGSSGDHDKDAYFDDDKDNDQGGDSGLSKKRGNKGENKGDTKRQKQDHGKQAKQMLLKMVDLFEETLLPSRKEKQLHQLQRGKLLARNIQLQYY